MRVRFLGNWIGHILSYFSLVGHQNDQPKPHTDYTVTKLILTYNMGILKNWLHVTQISHPKISQLHANISFLHECKQALEAFKSVISTRIVFINLPD